MGNYAARLSGPDRRQQILQVATQLFATQGFNGTTTRQIAETAGVNEALIFRHFPTKDDLYWGVIEENCRATRPQEELEKRLCQNLSHREMFSAIANDILDRRRDATRSRLLLFSALENHGLSERFFQTYIAKYFELLAGHIRSRIAAGEFREVDPLLAARGFIGMVIYHFLTQELFGGKRHQQFDQQVVCDTLADIWLAGMARADQAVHKGSEALQNGRAKGVHAHFVKGRATVSS